jgi:hypothetical protein
MDKELIVNNYPDEDIDEVLITWHMREVTVDDIFSSYIHPETGVRRAVMQPMFELKADDDPTPGYRWSPDVEIDEQEWLKNGRLVSMFS